MIPMTLEAVRQAIGGQWLRRGRERTIQGVSTDTRTARGGELFVALSGERFDGHRFLSAAVQAGCAAAVVRQGTALDDDVVAGFPAGVLSVSDTGGSLASLGRSQRRAFAGKVVAVTGSNGKTTVKRMLHAILGKSLRGTCSPKSFNNEIGLPLTLLGVGEGDDYVVCEIGTNHPGEIASLAALAEPDVAVITSVAEAHLEGLGSLAEIAAEKASILGAVRDRGVGVVWADSDVLDAAMDPYPVELVRFGESAKADLRLTAWRGEGWGQRFEVNGRDAFALPVPGKHNAMNALAAIAAASWLGVGAGDAAEALATFEPPEMRTQRLEVATVTVINDAYNANPASVLAAADVLAGMAATRRVMIVGEMRELGPAGPSLHEQVGRRIGPKVDLLVGVGELGRYIARSAASAGATTAVFDTPADVAAAIGSLLAPGDAVLLKASRSVGLECLVEPIRRAFGEQ